MQAALGFRSHSGWAALVVLGWPEPRVCARQTIVLADAAISGSKQPYHAAEPMPTAKAKAFLKRCIERSNRLAWDGLSEAVRSLRSQGYEVVACGLLSASGRIPDSVEAILASHAAIHAAEGELYRTALASACARCNLPLTRVREKDALDAAAAELGLPADEISGRIAAMGKTVGPPWSQDQKLAALAAWLAYAARASRARAAGKTA